MELELGCVDNFDFGDLDGDDNATGGDGWVLGETDDSVILTSMMVNTHTPTQSKSDTRSG